MEQRTAEEVRDRFVSEQDYIARYVDYLEEKSCFGDRNLIDLNIKLAKHGFGKYKYRNIHQMMNSFPYFSHEELLGLRRWADSLEKDVVHALAEGVSLRDALPTGELPEDASDVYQSIPYILDLVDDDLQIMARLDADVIAKVEGCLREMIAGADTREQHSVARWDVPPTLAEEAIASAIHWWVSQRVGELESIVEEFEDIRIIARTASPEAEINIHRQGFILLMTAFDAAIFDLVRVALTRRFFALASAFGRQDKISISEIAEAGSFEDLRDRLIEEQLKKRYIKDLLGMLNKEWEGECVNPAGSEKAVRLIEMVLRRNVHVHNRGVVDSRYVDDMNLDGLRIGQVAVIDQSYLKMSNLLCLNCVERVASWASA